MSVLLVTGAASGLGWALTRHWYAAGHDLVLADIDGAALAARAADLDPDRVLALTVDVTDAADLARLVEATQQRFGRLDVLVNNAGITHRSPAYRTDPAVFRTVMAVDWQGPVELTLAALPLLRAGGGTVVCISSMAGWMPVPGRAAYSAAKAALTQFFEVLRLELEPQGVRVLMVHPSFLDTPIDEHALGEDGRPTGRARSTVGRLRSAEETAVQVDAALWAGRRRLFPDRGTVAASLLWRLAPSVYQAQVRRRFADDLR
ncbi:2-(R)-hydroxypropyl-CoM dehydrogenase [Nocardioides dokdonensis FR1436]|uniref:2-(R)-hydroxypropyl-CoM dehydrogenase n=1 Tax=Nocardioides dokdonensis FR1436 TaxID=1300347 RepID=A0A1A9GI86_9ACTN|nr:SDR family NAD(P)-dependent oxidoreductase [Nocardioides dokdonensis]ANH37796.1 2-(R)-hydroxypropyl-CoM dehydrogenase [Nocardioides dokdonensis FR1436]